MKSFGRGLEVTLTHRGLQGGVFLERVPLKDCLDDIDEVTKQNGLFWGSGTFNGVKYKVKLGFDRQARRFYTMSSVDDTLKMPITYHDNLKQALKALGCHLPD